MKKLWLAILLLLLAVVISAQDTKSERKKDKLPSVDIKNIDGETFNTSDITNDGKPIIISFWATYCKPCIKELNAIADVYEEWQEETGVKLVAVSLDKTDRLGTVKNKVNGGSWEYQVLLDQNGDFKRAMNVGNVPHTFILNGKGEIVWQHTSYSPGGEEELIEIVEKLNNGEEIK